MNAKSKKMHRGLTMLETLAWAFFAILVIAGAVKLIAAVYDSFDTGSETSNIQRIFTSTKASLKYRGQYQSANMIQALIKYDGLPDSMIADDAGTTAKNIWGGSVTLVPSADKYSFILTYNKVPESACVSIVSKMRESTLVSKIDDVAKDKVVPENVCKTGDDNSIKLMSAS